MWKKLLIILGMAVIGGLLVYGGIYCAFLHPLSAKALEENAARGEPSQLIFPPTLLIFGVILIVLALKTLGPDTDFKDGFFYEYGVRGIPLILASLLSLTLPLLFLWQIWIVFTKDVFKGVPPIAWGRIGGVTTDWVIFVAYFIPWMIVALIGIIGPPVLFWAGVKK